MIADTTYQFEVESTDSAGNTQTDNNSDLYYAFITSTAPLDETTVSVSTVDLIGFGGKNADKHLEATVAVVSNLGNPVESASVTVEFVYGENTVDTQIGTTDVNGILVVSTKNVPSGQCYDANVTLISHAGLSFVPSENDTSNPSICTSSTSKGNSNNK